MDATRAPETSQDDRPVDGRRQRTLDSRARIIAAMLDLTHAGHISPSAEVVAERAHVGLRTVFRHFNDMDSLYRAMSLAVEARLRSEVPLGFVATTWRGQLAELIGRRTAAFDRIAPFKRAEAAHRHRSEVLRDDIVRMNQFLRDMLRRVLPNPLVEDQVLFETLDMLLSFEAWERLRREQGLTASLSRQVLETTVNRLLADLDPA